MFNTWDSNLGAVDFSSSGCAGSDGYKDKAAWKAAGKPSCNFTTQPAPAPFQQNPTGGTPGSVPNFPAGPSPTDGGSSGGGGIMDFISSIPTSYLLIGGAIVALMVFKK
jgi:hypothetical protein